MMFKKKAIRLLVVFMTLSLLLTFLGMSTAEVLEKVEIFEIQPKDKIDSKLADEMRKTDLDEKIHSAKS